MDEEPKPRTMPRLHPLPAACAIVAALPTCFALTASYADETAFTSLSHLIDGVWPYLNASGPFTGMLLFLAVAALEYCGFALLTGGRARSGGVTLSTLDAQGGNDDNDDNTVGTVGTVDAVDAAAARIADAHAAAVQPASAAQPFPAARTVDAPRMSARERGWSIALGLILALTLTVPQHSTTHLVSQLAATATPPAVAAEYRTVWYWLYYIVRYLGFAALLIALSALALHAAARAITRHEGGGAGKDAVGQSVAASPVAAEASVAPHKPHNVAEHRAAQHGAAEGTARHDIAHNVIANNGVARRGIARIRRTFTRTVTTLTPAHTLGLGAAILACWTPWIVLLWPANIAADTVAQLVWMRTGQAWDPSTHQMLPGYALSDQHPWLDSLIYGAFDQLGLRMGSEAWGLWLLALLQTALCAMALGLAINYLGGVMRVPVRYCAAALTFMALVPIYGRLMMSVVKDSTVMPFFIVLMVLVMEYVRRVRGGLRPGPWLLLGIVTLSVLCGLMRKISVEIIAATFVVFAIVIARRRLTSLTLAAVPLALGMIIGSVAAPALHVAPGGKQEMIAIPLQQTSAYVVAHGDMLSATDRDAIGRVITCPRDELDAYLTWNPWDGREIGSADVIKDRCFNRDATTRDIGAFLVVWAGLVARDPVTALAATPWLHDPFVMGPVYDEGWYVRWGWEEMGGTMILPEYASTWTQASVSAPQRIGRAAYTLLENVPGVSLLMRENLYTVWVPLFTAALCDVLRRRRNWVYLTPWAITICSLMLLPGHQTRYTWTLAFGVALIAAIPMIRDAGDGANGGADGGGIIKPDESALPHPPESRISEEQARRSAIPVQKFSIPEDRRGPDGTGSAQSTRPHLPD